jgi:predicted Zn-dependent protease
MNKFKLLGTVLLASVATTQAQDIEQAKKAIDAEQFEKAKSMLKSIVKASPSNGKASFLLGNVYLTQNSADSAKIYFDKGLTAANDANYNYIGLGQMALNKGNLTEAQSDFVLGAKDAKKKDVEPAVYIGKAYMNADKPDFVNALTVLNKAKLANPQDAQLSLALGDAYYGVKSQNESYVAYRDAFQLDPTLIRAKMKLGVLLKGAKAYPEAIKSFDEVIAINPNYGPVYRELAETYYYWANNDPKNYSTHIKKSLDYYEKYMSLTDYSLASRMRHADFLILAKDYKALEIEANQMKQLDKVNPRIYRYLGYSAYENGNTDASVQALETFIGSPTNKVIARDHLYLGLAKLKKSNNLETKMVDPVAFDAGVASIKKAVDMEITLTNDLNEVGKKFYEAKMFKEAAAIYEIAVTNVNSKNYILDNFYLGNALYFKNAKKDVAKPDPKELQKADVAYGNVITASPNTSDAYLYRGRVNSLLENDAMTVKYYDEYVANVTAKGAEELAKPATKTKVIESYNTIAAAYANTDKVKAKAYFAKTLALDPTNKYASDSLKSLK